MKQMLHLSLLRKTKLNLKLTYDYEWYETNEHTYNTRKKIQNSKKGIQNKEPENNIVVATELIFNEWIV